MEKRQSSAETKEGAGEGVKWEELLSWEQLGKMGGGDFVQRGRLGVMR